jgi:hypothetical protein
MGDIAPLSQLEHTRFRDALHTTPVKLGEFFEHGQPGLRNATLDAMGVPLGQLGFTERQQVAFAGEFGARRILGKGSIVLDEAGQLELAQIAFQQGISGHRFPPSSLHRA